MSNRLILLVFILIFCFFFPLSRQYTRIKDKDNLGSIPNNETDLFIDLRLLN